MTSANTHFHPSFLPLEGGVNFRDLGGNSGTDGRLIKKGLLFRSGALDQLTEHDCHYLSQLPVAHILDYRDPNEIKSKPDVLWQGVNYIHQPANPFDTAVTGNLTEIITHSLGEMNGYEFMRDLYRHLPFDNAAYRKLVNLLEQPGSTSVVQHCAVGKDRTGVGSALVMFILGAETATVMEDYLLTEIGLGPLRQHLFSHLAEKLNDNALLQLQYVMSAREDFLAAALQAIEERYGSIEGWLEGEFGLDRARRQAIQDKYLAE